MITKGLGKKSNLITKGMGKRSIVIEIISKINNIFASPTANSYSSVDYADDYFNSRLDYKVWKSKSLSEKERLLILATKMINLFKTNKSRATDKQALNYPLEQEEYNSTYVDISDLIEIESSVADNITLSYSNITKLMNMKITPFEDIKKFATIRTSEAFKKDIFYKLDFESITGGSINIYENDNYLETISNASTIQKILNGTAIVFENTESENDIVVNFKLDILNGSPSVEAAKKATIIQSIFMAKNEEIINECTNEINMKKEGFGHHSNEREITKINWYKIFSPGVINLMKPYIDLSRRLK